MTLLNRCSPYSSIFKKTPLSFVLASKLAQNSFPFVASRLDFHSSQKIFIDAYTRVPASQQPDLTGAHGKHILWVDLARAEFGRGAAVYEVDPSSFSNRLEKNSKMATALMRFLKTNKWKHPFQSIDSVLFYVEHGLDPPLEIWRALGGLSPKHLEICCGWNKDCHIESLDALQNQWNDLDTLCLEHVVGSDFMERAPVVFSRISYLSLVNCCGSNLIPPGVTRLRHLHISNENATEMFISQVHRNPRLASMLEVLDIQGMCGFEVGCLNDMPSFRECLEQCTNIHTLHLIVSPFDQLDDHLPSYLPRSIRNLTLCFPRSLALLDEMDDWINHASDRMWLPYLKTFKLTVDPEPRDRRRDFDDENDYPPRTIACDLPSRDAFESEFETKRGVLYEVLKSGRPGIELAV